MVVDGRPERGAEPGPARAAAGAPPSSLSGPTAVSKQAEDIARERPSERRGRVVPDLERAEAHGARLRDETGEAPGRRRRDQQGEFGLAIGQGGEAGDVVRVAAVPRQQGSERPFVGEVLGGEGREKVVPASRRRDAARGGPNPSQDGPRDTTERAHGHPAIVEGRAGRRVRETGARVRWR